MARGSYRALGSLVNPLNRPRGYQAQIRKPPTIVEMQFVPIATTLFASLFTALLPSIATAPTMPPWGLLMALGWRLLDREIWPAWAALGLGLFDDLFSGLPIGSAVMLWTISFLALEVFDRRMIWRDYKEDWALAAGLIAFVLLGNLMIANLTGGSTRWFEILPQIGISICCFPIVVRFCAMIDRLRRL